MDRINLSIEPAKKIQIEARAKSLGLTISGYIKFLAYTDLLSYSSVESGATPQAEEKRTFGGFFKRSN